MRWNHERQRLGNWVRVKRKAYWFSVLQLAQELGLSAKTIERLEHGHFYWAQLDLSIRRNLEELFGPYEIEAELAFSQNVEFRPADSRAAFRNEISDFSDFDGMEDEIRRILSEGQAARNAQPNGGRSNGPDESTPVSEDDAIEYICRWCKGLVLIKHDGLCPDPFCRRAQDNH